MKWSRLWNQAQDLDFSGCFDFSQSYILHQLRSCHWPIMFTNMFAWPIPTHPAAN